MPKSPTPNRAYPTPVNASCDPESAVAGVEASSPDPEPAPDAVVVVHGEVVDVVLDEREVVLDVVVEEVLLDVVVEEVLLEVVDEVLLEVVEEVLLEVVEELG